jgi:hypothetical protein
MPNLSPDQEARIAAKMLDLLREEDGVEVLHQQSLTLEPDWYEVFVDGKEVFLFDAPLTLAKITDATTQINRIRFAI